MAGNLPPLLARKLTQARQSAGVSREQAAVSIGRSWSSLAAYERGAIVPPLPVLDRLARLYGVRLPDLVTTELVVSDAA